MSLVLNYLINQICYCTFSLSFLRKTALRSRFGPSGDGTRNAKPLAKACVATAWHYGPPLAPLSDYQTDVQSLIQIFQINPESKFKLKLSASPSDT